MTTLPVPDIPPAQVCVDLRPYEAAAIDTLGIEVTPPLRSWRHDRWSHFAGLMPVTVAAAFETVNEIMTGRHAQRDEHFAVLHRVLHLHEYQLDPAEIWARRTAHHLVLDLPAFTARLEQALAEHKDPAQVFRRFEADWPLLQISPQYTGPAPVSTMVFDTAEDREIDPLDARAVAFRAGTTVSCDMTPRVTGHVLLISRRRSDGTLAVLNELLGLPRSEILPAGRRRDLEAEPWKGDPGLRDLVAVNWPEGLDKAAHDLEAFFKRTTPEITESELRRIGAALVATRDDDPAAALTAAVRRINMI